MITTTTQATTSPAAVLRNVAVTIIGLAFLLGVILAMRYVGERRMEQGRTVQPVITPAATMQPTPAPVLATSGMIVIPTGLADYPELHLTVERSGDAWIITDEDGDQGLCPQRPATYADLDSCEFIGG